MTKTRRRARKKQRKLRNHSTTKVLRIDVLPNEVLLEIFVNINSSYRDKSRIEAWQSLVHVCRRWRCLVFESPRYLDLQLVCTPKTPARGTLDIWPALPLLIKGAMTPSSGADNIIVALKQSNRVCEVFLTDLSGSQLEKVLAAMQVPFPKLTELRLKSYGEKTLAVPVPNSFSFLGGSAPRLRHFELSGIPLPGFPKPLLSSTRLYYLKLSDIPHSGYFSPEALMTLLSVLFCLEEFFLEFQSPRSHPDRETRPRSIRSTLPALKRLYFKGVTEYLEDLVTCIDAPQLKNFNITFFNQIDFDCPRLAQFINSTPTLRAHNEAHVQFGDSTVSVTLRSRVSSLGDLLINISCQEPDWQLSSIEQVCNWALPSLSRLEDLYIEPEHWRPALKNDAIEDTLWIELLFPFTAVKNLYVSRKFAPGIAAALQELVGGRITEVLPRLQNIFMEPLVPFQETIRQFVAARELSGQPIATSVWDPGTPPAMLHWKLLPFDYRPLKGKLQFDFAREVDEIVLADARGSPRPLSVLERNKSAAEPGLTEMVIHCAELPDWPVHVARQSGIRCVDVFDSIRDTYNVVLTTTERSIHQSRVRDIERRRPPTPEGAVRRWDLLDGKTLFLGLDWRTSSSRYQNGCWALKVGYPPT